MKGVIYTWDVSYGKVYYGMLPDDISGSTGTNVAAYTINNVSVLNTITSKTIILDTQKYTYDGGAKTPSVTVKDGNTTLVANRDYKVTYSNNTNVGTATVTITGQGNYIGTKTTNFSINKATIKVNISGTRHAYDGAAHGISISVGTPSTGAKVLYGTERGKYTLTESPKYTDAGTYPIYYKVTATNYNDLEGTQNLEITGIDVNTLTSTISTNTYKYDGTAKTPEVTIKEGQKNLQKDRDYRVAYSNNINAGTGTLTITGQGNYSGTKTINFTITAKDINSESITLEKNTYTYDGRAKTPVVTVKDGSKTLTANTDYKVEYSNNTNVGTATVAITGQGNYTKTITKQFTIIKADIVVEEQENTITYDGQEHGITPNITTELRNPTIKYGTSEDECNLVSSPKYVNVGTYKIYYEISADNYNQYKGSMNLVINAKSIKQLNLTVEQEKYVYNGAERKPALVLKDGNTILVLDKDYKVEYSNNKNVGTAKIEITGIGNYKENISHTFIIEKADPTYRVPSGIVTAYGSKLKDVKLPEGFSWEEDLETDVGELGLNTFTCTYKPEDTANYNIITGLKVTVKVTEKLVVNIEKYITTMAEDEKTIYISGINAETSLERVQRNIETNGIMTIFEADGTKVTDNKEEIKTGMKLEIKTEAEEINYIYVVTGDNNGDGKFNSKDLLKLARYLAKIEKDLTGEYLYASNVYADKVINQTDLLKMARVMSGLDYFN